MEYKSLHQRLCSEPFFFFPRFPDGPDGLHELLKSRGRCSGSALQGLERGATIPKLPCFSLVSSELQDYNPEQGPGSLNWMFVVLFFKACLMGADGHQ